MDYDIVYLCPEHLCSERQYFVQSVSSNGLDFVADLPNLEDGRHVLIGEPIAHELEMLWRLGRVAFLEISGGSVRPDDVLVPDSMRVKEAPEPLNDSAPNAA